jgi:hypothetical protein
LVHTDFFNFRTGTGDWPKLERGTKDLQLELDRPKTCFHPSFGSKNLKLKEKNLKKNWLFLLGLNMLVI